MNNQTIKRKAPKCTDRVVFDRICFIKLKRIAKDISREELSFSVGRPKNFVSRVEAFMPRAEYMKPNFSPRILKITQTGYAYTYKKREDKVLAPIVESLDKWV